VILRAIATRPINSITGNIVVDRYSFTHTKSRVLPCCRWVPAGGGSPNLDRRTDNASIPRGRHRPWLVHTCMGLNYYSKRQWTHTFRQQCVGWLLETSSTDQHSSPLRCIRHHVCPWSYPYIIHRNANLGAGLHTACALFVDSEAGPWRWRFFGGNEGMSECSKTSTQWPRVSSTGPFRPGRHLFAHTRAAAVRHSFSSPSYLLYRCQGVVDLHVTHHQPVQAFLIVE
jgi:hypothetical protein